MKTILMTLVALLAINYASLAQVQNITVVNNTHCTAVYRLTAGATTNCNPAVTSAAFTLVGGASITYTDPSQVPGGGYAATDYFKAVDVYNVPAPCVPNAIATVFECTGFSGYVAVHPTGLFDPATCGFCSTATVTWTPTGPNSAIVSIDP